MRLLRETNDRRLRVTEFDQTHFKQQNYEVYVPATDQIFFVGVKYQQALEFVGLDGRGWDSA